MLTIIRSKVKLTSVIIVINYVKRYALNIFKTIHLIVFITHKIIGLDG